MAEDFELSKAETLKWPKVFAYPLKRIWPAGPLPRRPLQYPQFCAYIRIYPQECAFCGNPRFQRAMRLACSLARRVTRNVRTTPVVFYSEGKFIALERGKLSRRPRKSRRRPRLSQVIAQFWSDAGAASWRTASRHCIEPRARQTRTIV